MEGTRFGSAKRICALWASPVAQLVKNSPAMQETWVQSLGWKDPPEKGKATHSIFWPEELHGLYNPWGRKESDTPERLSLHFPSLSRGYVYSLLPVPFP